MDEVQGGSAGRKCGAMHCNGSIARTRVCLGNELYPWWQGSGCRILRRRIRRCCRHLATFLTFYFLPVLYDVVTDSVPLCCLPVSMCPFQHDHAIQKGPQIRASHRIKSEAPAACSALHRTCHWTCGRASAQYVMKS